MGWSCEPMHKVEDARDKLIDSMIEELSKPECDVDTDELGKVVDMIKDLSKAEKNCFEAWYYYCMAKHMEDQDEDDDNPAMTCADHYKGFKEATDMHVRNMHVDGFVGITSSAMKEMYMASDMEMRKKMKTDMTRLVSEMV